MKAQTEQTERGKLVAKFDAALIAAGARRAKHPYCDDAYWTVGGEWPLTWNASGFARGVTIEAVTVRFSSKPTGFLRVQVAGLRQTSGKTLPERTFDTIRTADSKEADAALKFALKRIEAVKADIAAIADQENQEARELAELRKAVKRQDFPAHCWVKSKYESDGRCLVNTPVLRDGELRIEVNETEHLTALQVAKLADILGDAKIKIKLDHELTPAQWLAYLEWRKGLDIDGR